MCNFKSHFEVAMNSATFGNESAVFYDCLNEILNKM